MRPRVFPAKASKAGARPIGGAPSRRAWRRTTSSRATLLRRRGCPLEGQEPATCFFARARKASWARSWALLGEGSHLVRRVGTREWRVKWRHMAYLQSGLASSWRCVAPHDGAFGVLVPAWMRHVCREQHPVCCNDDARSLAVTPCGIERAVPWGPIVPMVGTKERQRGARHGDRRGDSVDSGKACESCPWAHGRHNHLRNTPRFTHHAPTPTKIYATVK
jgi:hypothetical protein